MQYTLDMKNRYQQITIAIQTTALVPQKLDQANRVASTQKIMHESSCVEHVGFLDRSALPYPTITMMGDDWCSTDGFSRK